MQPAADRMAEALAAVTVRPLAAPVIANVTARPVCEPDSVRRLLVEQVTGRVRWRESILSLRGLGIETSGRIRRQQGPDRHGQAHRQGSADYHAGYAGGSRKPSRMKFELHRATQLRVRVLEADNSHV